MATQILMPALSPTMEEGTLAKWLVKEGDSVTSGQIIAEIETDKATMEFEAVDEGKVGRILIDEGTEGVKVNTPIAVLLDDGEEAGAAIAATQAVPNVEKPAAEAKEAPAPTAPAQPAAPEAVPRFLRAPASAPRRCGKRFATRCPRKCAATETSPDGGEEVADTRAPTRSARGSWTSSAPAE